MIAHWQTRIYFKINNIRSRCELTLGSNNIPTINGNALNAISTGYGRNCTHDFQTSKVTLCFSKSNHLILLLYDTDY